MCNGVDSIIIGSQIDLVLPSYYNLTFFTTLLTAVLHEGEETLALFVLRSYIGKNDNTWITFWQNSDVLISYLRTNYEIKHTVHSKLYIIICICELQMKNTKEDVGHPQKKYLRFIISDHHSPEKYPAQMLEVYRRYTSFFIIIIIILLLSSQWLAVGAG